MNPRLIHPFLEEKSVKTIPVNEEGLDGLRQGQQTPIEYNDSAF